MVCKVVIQYGNVYLDRVRNFETCDAYCSRWETMDQEPYRALQ